MAEQKSRRGIVVGAGILIGVLVTLLALALVAAIGFFTMGRCPMCGRMWGDGMPGGMMDGGMQDGEMPGWMMSRDMMSGEMTCTSSAHDGPALPRNFQAPRKDRTGNRRGTGWVRVAETSEDPEVVLLIRQHALRAVSEFVEGGMRRAMQPTPLPDEYQASDGIVNDG